MPIKAERHRRHCLVPKIAIQRSSEEKFEKVGIDMSSIFDTMNRNTTNRITRPQVKIDKSASKVFETTIGSFQGDSLCGIFFFILYLAAALRLVRSLLSRPNPLNWECSLPLESEYADDVEYISEGLMY